MPRPKRKKEGTQSSVSEESECFENEIVNRIKTLDVAIKNNANENTQKLFEEIEKLLGAFHDTRSTHQKQNKHSAILQHAQPDKPKTQTHTGGTSTRKDREKSRSPANVTNYSATTNTPEPTASVVCSLASTPCERVDSPTQELDHINVTPVQKRLISMAGALDEEGWRKND
ncbi:hypothetical protein ElyMa_001391900 [Elysia marginata]|uniref:Uncharacterized protein n=1 Tax=Elysia marginata TaxID=1093978 RepID=A0AAV4ISR8_9GAST|nr:hypothetical protein ElyMa_001391900 [Elysia marginata]